MITYRILYKILGNQEHMIITLILMCLILSHGFGRFWYRWGTPNSIRIDLAIADASTYFRIIETERYGSGEVGVGTLRGVGDSRT